MSALRPLLLLLLHLCPGLGPGHGSEAKVVRSCAETRQVLGARGYSLNLIPPSLISGEKKEGRVGVGRGGDGSSPSHNNSFLSVTIMMIVSSVEHLSSPVTSFPGSQ
jgi:hypothetical protein